LPYNLEVVNVVENNVLAIQRLKILPPASAEVVYGKRPKWLFSIRNQPLKDNSVNNSLTEKTL
jgi:hypothetical protein